MEFGGATIECLQVIIVESDPLQDPTSIRDHIKYLLSIKSESAVLTLDTVALKRIFGEVTLMIKTISAVGLVARLPY